MPARVLAAWDRHTDIDSRGAVLFQLFVDRYFSAAGGGMAGKLRVKYDPAQPLESAHGLADPQGPQLRSRRPLTSASSATARST